MGQGGEQPQGFAERLWQAARLGLGVGLQKRDDLAERARRTRSAAASFALPYGLRLSDAKFQKVATERSLALANADFIMAVHLVMCSSSRKACSCARRKPFTLFTLNAFLPVPVTHASLFASAKSPHPFAGLRPSQVLLCAPSTTDVRSRTGAAGAAAAAAAAAAATARSGELPSSTRTRRHPLGVSNKVAMRFERGSSSGRTRTRRWSNYCSVLCTTVSHVKASLSGLRRCSALSRVPGATLLPLCYDIKGPPKRRSAPAQARRTFFSSTTTAAAAAAFRKCRVAACITNRARQGGMMMRIRR
ncbi:hypothetical protein CC78DRAFT_246170 [Lojkania enalia]|uniref:Uncharacterized protein n=1 Tax=Lojkania enalia TaxID=147567 RepID=A0A9P4K7Y9_9PLEO|nr:hypothetical protein CC78DRAFT_246170 [Didymosphaeria enalia]